MFDQLDKHLDSQSGKKGVPILPGNGEIIIIREADYMPSLPPRVRQMVDDMGYVARFYTHEPGFMARIIETSLKSNREIGSIDTYNSSFLRKEKLYGNLVYHAAVQIKMKTGGMLDVKEEIETEVAVIAIFKHALKPENTVLLLASADVQRFDSWLDQVTMIVEHYLVMKKKR